MKQKLIKKFIPRSLKYWILIDAWAEATTGKYSHKEAPAITMQEVLEIYED